MKSIPVDYSLSSLSPTDIKDRLSSLSPQWEVVEGQKLRRVFTFKDFPHALNFVNKVAELAAEADHHPDIHIQYNKVTLELWTHSASGITQQDFDLAKKIEALTSHP